MQSGYTCQRCLHALRRLKEPRRASPSHRKIFTHRYLSTIPKSSEQYVFRSTLQAGQRRSIASVEGQIRVPNYEPPASRPLGLKDNVEPPVSGNVLLQPDNLFHHFSHSPSPDLRKRAAFMKSHAYCPHPSHHQTRMPDSSHDSEARKANPTQPPAHVRFECPDCGIPVSCSEEHWADDYESHMEICDTLREVNEDDHDLRSGRFFPEFELPGPQMEEALVNMTNWDTYLYTREHQAINEERPLRQLTKLLTYPVTIGSVLSELSPYSYKTGDRLTTEGLKSFSGISLSYPSFSPYRSLQPY